jgi:hypothetical protein
MMTNLLVETTNSNVMKLNASNAVSYTKIWKFNSR